MIFPSLKTASSELRNFYKPEMCDSLENVGSGTSLTTSHHQMHLKVKGTMGIENGALCCLLLRSQCVGYIFVCFSFQWDSARLNPRCVMAVALGYLLELKLMNCFYRNFL